MSLVFIPVIPLRLREAKTTVPNFIEEYVAPSRAVREYNSWSHKDLTTMVYLKALGVSYREIGKVIHRSQSSCALALSRNDLKGMYKGIRAELLDQVTAEVDDEYNKGEV